MTSSSEESLSKEKDFDTKSVPETLPLARHIPFYMRIFLWSKEIPQVPERISEKYPLHKASFLNAVTFGWVTPIITKGYQRQLTPEDLYQMEGTDYSTEVLSEKFKENLGKRIRSFQQKHPGEKWPKWQLILALNDTFFFNWWLAGVFKIISDVGNTLNPLLVRALIKFVGKRVRGEDVPTSEGVGYTIGMCVIILIVSLALNHSFHFAMLTGANIKTVLTNVIFEKSFKLSNKAKLDWPQGKISSLAMTDLSRIDLACSVFHFLYSFPIALIVALVLLLTNVGAAGLVGWFTVVVFICLTVVISRFQKPLRMKANMHTDRRVNAISELINNLKMIKFYSWEKPYNEKVQNIRDDEMNIVLTMNFVRAAIFTIVSTLSIFSTMLMFLTMYKTGFRLTPSNVFTSVSLLNIMRQPMKIFPMALSTSVDALIALQRVCDFLQSEESNGDSEFVLPKDETSPNALQLQNASFTYERSKDENEIEVFELKSLNLNIRRGEFIIVTGPIGSGKTSLLNAMAGIMRQTAGSLQVNDFLTYCSYPWVQNATIKENITFGKKDKDPTWYDKVVNACCLLPDFDSLEAGDRTEVGERGITLSGGQKARINLARAVYARHQNAILLLDDVLSAVDARVGKHIMQHCFIELLHGHTRVLATHQLSLASNADRVCFMNGDGTITVGTVSELMEKSLAFKALMNFNAKEVSEEEDIENILDVENDVNPKKLKDIVENVVNDYDEQAFDPEEFKVNNFESEKYEIKKIKTSQTEISVTAAGKTTIAEAMNSGSIPVSLYFKSILMGSGIFGKLLIFPLIAVLASGVALFPIFQSVWLTFWLENKFGYSQDTYMGLYIMFCFLAVIFQALYFFLIAYVNNRLALNLFKMATANLLRVPMSFMDTTPLGRILNRFTKDIDTVDTDNSDHLRMFMATSILGMSIIVLCCIYLPWFTIALPFLGFFYWNLNQYYTRSAIDLKRLESVKRSFVYSHFNESLNGMATLKAYHVENQFQRKFVALSDSMCSAYYLTTANSRWFSVRLDCIAAAVTFLVEILCITGAFHISAANTGLVISYVTQLSLLMSVLMRSITLVQNNMNSIERLYEYAYDLPNEKAFEITETQPCQDWPQEGEVEFQNASLNYRPGLPLVLKNVSIKSKRMEKIGICGRTGAGKSTIMNALFRINELQTGTITIDGVDISTLGLHQLRSKISIIPQDPVLFEGTIRENLDPFGQCSDEQLWDAMRRSWLVGESIRPGSGKSENTASSENSKFQLDQYVQDNGANFSLGERQLLALARALVRQSKILILDEATSSVDYETDAKIQHTINTEFNNCTILCIAHRLKTILHYDRILVLDHGEVCEFDTPLALFQDETSIFREMCNKSSITADDFSSA